MESVRSGSGCDVDDTARCASVFSREVAGDDLELLNGIKRHALAHCRREGIFIFAAVKQDVRAGCSLAIDREACAAAKRASARGVPRCSDKIVWVASQRR